MQTFGSTLVATPKDLRRPPSAGENAAQPPPHSEDLRGPVGPLCAAELVLFIADDGAVYIIKNRHGAIGPLRELCLAPAPTAGIRRYRKRNAD